MEKGKVNAREIPMSIFYQLYTFLKLARANLSDGYNSERMF
jgi:hypothetical protein